MTGPSVSYIWTYSLKKEREQTQYKVKYTTEEGCSVYTGFYQNLQMVEFGSEKLNTRFREALDIGRMYKYRV